MWFRHKILVASLKKHAEMIYCPHSQVSRYHHGVVVLLFSISVRRCCSFKLGHIIGAGYVALIQQCTVHTLTYIFPLLEQP